MPVYLRPHSTQRSGIKCTPALPWETHQASVSLQYACTDWNPFRWGALVENPSRLGDLATFPNWLLHCSEPMAEKPSGAQLWHWAMLTWRSLPWHRFLDKSGGKEGRAGLGLWNVTLLNSEYKESHGSTRAQQIGGYVSWCERAHCCVVTAVWC